MRTIPKRHVLLCCVSAWGGCVLLGGYMLMGYSLASTATKNVSLRWPADSRIERFTDRKSLVVFLHPRCGCSRATLKELSKSLKGADTSVALTCVFYRPRRSSSAWLDGVLWDSARQISGCRCVVDVGGLECRTFGVQTSGHVLLFDEVGNRLFSGGVTSSRGHEGDNLGGDRLAKQIRNPDDKIVGVPVFGCQIVSSESTVIGSGGASYE